MIGTNRILMIKPANFGYNEQTANSNLFQNKIASTEQEINLIAQKEFDNMVDQLKQNNINVTVIEDTTSPIKPDAIFPNNWITTHKDGSVYLFPMAAINRQYERREDIITNLKESYRVSKVVDLSYTEADNRFLEGTGSIVFDHSNKTAFACLSPRTDRGLFNYYCREIGYKPICFTATDSLGNEIYHTNVMMCVGHEFAVVCMESIENDLESEQIEQHFEGYDKELITISRAQMNQFAGNMIQLKNDNEEHFIVTSKTAYNSLNEEQIERISAYVTFIIPDIPTIEKVGGGGVRCMIAENYLPLK